MQRFCLSLVLASLVCITALAAPQSPKKDDKKKDEPARVIIVGNRLPTGWKALGLSAKQRKEVLLTMGKYAAKRQALMEQIQKLKEEEMQECEKILTKTQKDRLKEIRKK